MAGTFFPALFSCGLIDSLKDADVDVGVRDGARGGALAQLRERAFEDLGRRKWIGGEVLNADKGKVT